MPAYADLVHQTSTSIGTGNQTLAAVNGKRTFAAALGSGGTNTFDYYISHREQPQWERGTGHESGGALVRDTVIASSNANAAVNFSAGVKDITNDQPAAYRVDKSYVDAADAGKLSIGGGTLTGNLQITPATGAATLHLNPAQAAQQATINFSQGGVGKWQLGKQTDDTFILYDIAGGAVVMDIPSPGTVINFNKPVKIAATSGMVLWAIGPAAQIHIGYNGSGDSYFDQTTLHFRNGLGGAEIATLTGSGLALLQTTATSGPTTGALTVAGGVGIGGNISIGGNLAVGSASAAPMSGRSLLISSAGQPAFAFKHEPAAATKRVMGWIYDGAVALSDPGMVFQNLDDNGGFVANTGCIWRDGGLSLGDISRPNGGAGGLRVASAVASASTNTGALTVAGGVGIGGALYTGGLVSVGGPLYVNTNTIAIYGPAGFSEILFSPGGSTRTGQIYQQGDVLNFASQGVGAKLSVDLNTGVVGVLATTASSSATTGALTVAGGVGIGGSLNVQGAINAVGSGIGALTNYYLAGKKLVENSASNYTRVYDWDGANVLAIGTNADPGTYHFNTTHYFRNRVGSATFATLNATKLDIPLTTTSSSPTTGALTVAGGVGIGGDAQVGGNFAIVKNAATATICANGGNASIVWQLSGNSYFTQALAVGNGAMYFLDLDQSHGVGIGQDQNGWSAASDRRLPYKRNARTLESLLDRIDQFRLIEFGPEHKNVGVIAQELRRFVPHLVTPGVDDDERDITNITDPGCWTVMTAESGLVALQVAKEIWQRLGSEISDLKARVAEMEAA